MRSFLLSRALSSSFSSLCSSQLLPLFSRDATCVARMAPSHFPFPPLRIVCHVRFQICLSLLMSAPASSLSRTALARSDLQQYGPPASFGCYPFERTLPPLRKRTNPRALIGEAASIATSFPSHASAEPRSCCEHHKHQSTSSVLEPRDDVLFSGMVSTFSYVKSGPAWFRPHLEHLTR